MTLKIVRSRQNTFERRNKEKKKIERERKMQTGKNVQWERGSDKGVEERRRKGEGEFFLQKALQLAYAFARRNFINDFQVANINYPKI